MPGKKVPGITTSAAPTEAVPDMCETTIRDKHVAINEKGLVVDDQRMDDRKTIPLEGARPPVRGPCARALAGGAERPHVSAADSAWR